MAARADEVDELHGQVETLRDSLSHQTSVLEELSHARNAVAFSKLGMFSGMPGESWADFLEKWELLAMAKALSPQKKLLNLPLHLTGVAFDQYRALKADQKGSYDSLIRALTNVFSTETHIQDVTRELHRIRQGNTETISEFAARLRTLSRSSAYSRLEADAQNCILKELFCEKLRPEIRLLMSLSGTPPKTFEEAIAAARRFESSDGILGPLLKSGFAGEKKPGRINSQIYATEIGVRRPPSPNRNYATSNDARRPPERRQGVRFNSRPTNQYQSNSYANAPTGFNGYRKAGSPPFSQYGRTMSGGKRCYGCNREGHLFRECRSSRGNNQMSPRNQYRNQGGNFKRNVPQWQGQRSNNFNPRHGREVHSITMQETGYKQGEVQERDRQSNQSLVEQMSRLEKSLSLLDSRNRVTDARAYDYPQIMAFTLEMESEGKESEAVSEADSYELLLDYDEDWDDMESVGKEIGDNGELRGEKEQEKDEEMNESEIVEGEPETITGDGWPEVEGAPAPPWESGSAFPPQPQIVQKPIDFEKFKLAFKITPQNTSPEIYASWRLCQFAPPYYRARDPLPAAPQGCIPEVEEGYSTELMIQRLEQAEYQVVQHEQRIRQLERCLMGYGEPRRTEHNGEYGGYEEAKELRFRFTPGGAPICSYCHQAGHVRRACSQWFSHGQEGTQREINAFEVINGNCVHPKGGGKEREGTHSIPLHYRGWLFLCCLSFFLTGTMANNNTYYLCGEGEVGTVFHIPKFVTCLYPQSIDKIITETVELIIPSNKIQRIPIFTCRMMEHKICTRMGVFFSKGIVSSEIIEKQITPSECWNIVTSKRWDNTSLIQIGEKSWSTNNTLLVDYKYCCVDYCASATNVVLEESTAITEDGVIGQSATLQEMPALSLRAGYATHGRSTTVWQDSNVSQDFCPFVKKGTYPATISNRHVIIDEIQGAFSFKNADSQELHRCLPKDSFKADQTGVYIRFTNRTKPWRWEQTKERRKVPDFQKMDHNVTQDFSEEMLELLSKVNFLADKIEMKELQRFQELYHSLCQLSNRQLMLIWALLAIEPSLAARALFQKDDLHARWDGELLSVWRCASIQPDLIVYDKKVGDTCYRDTPMYFKGKLYFHVPGTSDVTDSSPTIPCKYNQPALMQAANGKWMKGASYIYPQTVPLVLAWSGHWAPTTLDAPEIFHHNLRLGLETSINDLRSALWSQRRLERQMNSLVQCTAEGSLHPDLTKKMLIAAKEGAQDIGHAISDTTHGLLEGVSAVLKGPIQYLINVVVIAAICILIVTICVLVLYCCCKWCAFRKRIVRFFFGQSERPRPNAEVELVSLASRRGEMHRRRSDTYREIVERSRQLQEEAAILQLEFPGDRPGVLSAVKIYINNQDCTALVDTGATTSVVSLEACHRFGWEVTPSPDNPVIRLLSGKVDMSGTLIATVCFPGTQAIYWFSFQVLKELKSYDVILGTNFFNIIDQPISFDYARHRLNVLGVSLSFVDIAKSPVEYTVTAMETLRVSSRTEIIFEAPVNAPPGNYDFISNEDCPLFLPDARVQVGWSTKLNQPAIQIVAVNFSLLPQTLYANSTLGKLFLIDRSIAEADFDQSPDLRWGDVQFVDEDTAIPRTKSSGPIDFRNTINLPNWVTIDQKERVLNLLEEFRHVFSANDRDLGRTDLFEHRVETVGEPFVARPYRIPHSEQRLFEQHIKEMLAADIIRPSTSNWCSPAFLIKKKAELPSQLSEKPLIKPDIAPVKDNKSVDTSQSRIIVDLRGVNRRTVISKFPLPDLVTLMAGLGNAKLICQFDFTSAYYQLPVHEGHRHKTAFAACSGLYEFNVVPLGCAGGPASFCLLAQKVLREMIPDKAVIYLDDALVYGNSFESVLEHLREFFTRIANAKLKLKWRKCNFFQSEISYLGYQISSRGVRPDPSNIEKVKNFPPITNAKGARRFVALCAYYKRLIKDFSQLTEPLNALQRKNVPFHWTELHQECFVKLRDALCSYPLVCHPRYDLPFILRSDCSDVACGSVLVQEHEDGVRRVIGYSGKTLNPAQRNYTVTEKELFGIVSALQSFKHIIYGYPLIVETDHAALSYILRSRKLPPGRLSRWMMVLLEQPMEIRHVPGERLADADCLSRLGQSGEEDLTCEGGVVNAITRSQTKKLQDTLLAKHPEDEKEIRQVKDEEKVGEFKHPEVEEKMGKFACAQQEDEQWKDLIIYLETQELPLDNQKAKIISNISADYTLIDGLLHRIDLHSDAGFLLVVPEVLKEEVLNSLHGAPWAGHFSLKKVFKICRQKYYWPHMFSDIKKFCAKCYN